MPSTSPGGRHAPPPISTTFDQILPGAATPSLQGLTTFTWRLKRYIAYISGRHLNLLSAPTVLVQVITFEHDLVALSSDWDTGRLVVAEETDVWVLQPVVEDWTKVWWERALLLQHADGDDAPRCVCWANEGEVLVGGSRQLALFSTLSSSRTSSPVVPSLPYGDVVTVRKPLWTKPVASAIQHAAFSPSASLIATCGRYDRLVKIWRRLSHEEGLFDHTYLPHPSAVTHLQWRPQDQYSEERRGSGISGRHDEDPEVLYTFSSDGLFRVWRTGGLHDLEILVLHSVVDLVSAIPQSPDRSVHGTPASAKPPRYGCMLPSDVFSDAVAAAIRRQTPGKTSHALEHLKEITSKTPDIVVALDGEGRMSAWGLQSISHKRRPDSPGSTEAFHIAHAEDLRMRLSGRTNARFEAWFGDDTFHVLVQNFEGEITWWQGDVETFFSPSSPGTERLTEMACFGGQRGSVNTLRAIKDGATLVSWTSEDEAVVWRERKDGLLVRDPLEQAKGQSVEPAKVDIRYETGISNPSVVASNSEFAALATGDRKHLVIIELREGYIERQETFEKLIRHLCCFGHEPQSNLLAIGFDNHIDVLAQGRYERDSLDASNWALVKRVSIAGLGPPISALEWMSNGRLAIGGGPGVLLSSNKAICQDPESWIRESPNIKSTPGNESMLGLLQLSRAMVGPVPVWHPALLCYLVYDGRAATALSILPSLLDKLKFWGEGEDMNPLLNFKVDDILRPLSHRHIDSTGSDTWVNELSAQLEEKKLPLISFVEQERLRRVFEAIVYISGHLDGLDINAQRYLFSWRLQLLLMRNGSSEVNGTIRTEKTAQADHNIIPEMQWREITFAHHSTTQQPLLDILILHYDNKLTWPIVRGLGITAWLSEKESLETVFESLAQSAYRATNPPDPTHASLYFLALHKKSTLLGLWRIATWHREQRATTTFLKRDFSQTDAKTAAKKNAYALMGKRRFQYAAAFFLLADDAASATSVLAGQCEDSMLAVAVARLCGSERCDILGQVIGDRLLPKAMESGDRWLMTWSHTLALQKREAVNSLIKPLDGVRYFHQDDPMTLLLYKDLRSAGSAYEYSAVLRAARILRRMGLVQLALNLVSNWEFSSNSDPPSSTSWGDHSVGSNDVVRNEPPSMLDDFSSLSISKSSREQSPTLDHLSALTSVNDVPSVLDGFTGSTSQGLQGAADEKTAREAKAAELLANLKARKAAGQQTSAASEEKRAPTQFQEPDADSLLNSFGF